MRTTTVEIDSDITLLECMRMAWHIGCTVRPSQAGRLVIMRRPAKQPADAQLPSAFCTSAAVLAFPRGEKCEP